MFESEDELWEALHEGLITYDQYIVLREIIENGLDSTNRHLLDEIPNLIYLFKTDSALADPLEQDQSIGFRESEKGRPRVDRVSGRIGHRYNMVMDEEQQSWYRSYADISILNRWRIRMLANRERSGVERVINRSVGYRSRTGLVRRIEGGSFTTRFGLGSLFGHRGRIMITSSHLDGESLLYPSYGGFNGVLAELRSGGWDMRSLASLARDSTHRLVTGGLMFQRATGRLRPGLAAGYVNLVNRNSGSSMDMPMAAALMQYDYKTGYVSTELSYQGGSQVSAINALIEGRHRFETAELRYAAWRYDDEFVDLTAGSKSGVLSGIDSLETVAFTYRSRRVGQTGGLARTSVELGRSIILANSLLFASNARDARRQQFSSSLIYGASSDWQWRLAYLGDWRRDPVSIPINRSDHQVRLEARYATVRIRARCYIGYDVNSRDEDNASFFVSARYLMIDGSAYELWSNLGKFDADGINYWYVFARGLWPLSDHLNASAKLSNSYRRESLESNTTQLSLELTAEL